MVHKLTGLGYTIDAHIGLVERTFTLCEEGELHETTSDDTSGPDSDCNGSVGYAPRVGNVTVITHP